jgi:hypothetical protein
MKKFLIAGSSLAAVAAAGSAGAVDVTLGGSIDMGVDFGLGKAAGEMAITDTHNKITLKLSAAGTTDGGLKYGGSFGMGTDAELSFAPYAHDGKKYLVKATQEGPTDIIGNARAVSGGATVGGASGGNIVAVKINSDWVSVGDTQTAYKYPSSGNFQSTNICKIAGYFEGVESGSTTIALYESGQQALGPVGSLGGIFGPGPESVVVGPTPGPESYLPYGVAVARDDGAGSWDAVQTLVGGFAISKSGTAENGYLAAGRVLAGVSPDFAGYLAASALVESNVSGLSVGFVVEGARVLFPLAASNESITVREKARVTVKPSIPSAAKGDKSTPYQPQVTYVVDSAAVYAGPFMEVQLASSTTKMVVGAVCVAGIEASETVYHMNNKSKVVTATDASIYIEGGFGKLTLQTGDYAGAVSAIGGAGDVAGIDADGLVVVASGLGMMGANPYLAMDLAAGSSVGAIEMAAGGSINFAGMSGAMDIQLADGGLASVIGTEISGWDLGLTYQMGDMALAFATDSENDWGLSASMAVAGFGVDAVFSSEGTGDHEKSGIMYSVTASTSLNGFGLSIGVDQGLEPTIGLSYALGALSLYAGYDASETGGTAGAKLSF